VTSTAGCKDTFTRQITLETSGIRAFGASDWKVVPNPFNDELRLIAPFEQNESISIKLIDILGQLISEQKFEKMEGKEILMSFEEKIKSGQYILLISTEMKHWLLRVSSSAE
jgi:hypothetical protein